MSMSTPITTQQAVGAITDLVPTVTHNLQASLPALTALWWVLVIVGILLSVYLIIVIWQRIAFASAVKHKAEQVEQLLAGAGAGLMAGRHSRRAHLEEL